MALSILFISKQDVGEVSKNLSLIRAAVSGEGCELPVFALGQEEEIAQFRGSSRSCFSDVTGVPQSGSVSTSGE